MRKALIMFGVDLMLAASAVLVITGCSMPTGQPTAGQQAVLASAAHRTTDAELVQQASFMRSFQAMQVQGRAAK